MKSILFACLILLLSSCSNGPSSYDDYNTRAGSSVNSMEYSEAVVDAAVYEAQNSTEFLSTTGSYRPNLGGYKMVIEGYIMNTATKATYKDVVIEFVFYTKTDSELSREKRVFYEYYTPGQKRDFKLRIKTPRSTEKVNWRVVSAGAN